jgi:hypothetical protein
VQGKGRPMCGKGAWELPGSFPFPSFLNECKLRRLVSQQVMECGTGFLREAF